MRTHLIPLTVVLTLLGVTAPTVAQDSHETACFVVSTGGNSNKESEGLKLRLEATLPRYAPLCSTVMGERRAVIVSVVVMLDNGYYYASHFLEADTDQGLRLHRQSMQLHAQSLDDLVDHVVTEALSMLRRVQS